MATSNFDSFVSQSQSEPVNIVIAGYLYKKPEKNSFLWKKRYCVIYDSELSIVYFESEDDAKKGVVRGKIPFSSVHDWDGKPNGFQFFTPNSRCYRVYTDTPEERTTWMNTMQELINKAPETVDGVSVGDARPVASSPQASNRLSRADSWRSEDIDVDSLLQEVEDLRSQVANARSELVSYEKTQEKSDEVSMRQRRGSILEDGTEVDLEPQEMERMRNIFNLFDSEGNGFISADDVKNLHKRLGEPISDEDASAAIDFINPVDGKVDFNSFIKWWNEDHTTDESAAMKRYQAKFKFLKARIANPTIGNIMTEAVGPFPSFEFRVNYYYEGNDGRVQISPWHDIPLYNHDGSVNFICEIPKWTRKKMEIATGEPFNPIKQDTKNGKLREYTWGDMMFNYGALPQTWEDPEHVTEGTGCHGDNDPIDVVEIGTKQWRTGAVVQVKVLGVLALIDSGETDWKLICINVEDPYASKLNDVVDVESYMPGCIGAIRDWFKDYKLPTINEFGFEGKCMNRAFAESVVAETHEFWKALIEKQGGQATV